MGTPGSIFSCSTTIGQLQWWGPPFGQTVLREYWVFADLQQWHLVQSLWTSLWSCTCHCLWPAWVWSNSKKCVTSMTIVLTLSGFKWCHSLPMQLFHTPILWTWRKPLAFQQQTLTAWAGRPILSSALLDRPVRSTAPPLVSLHCSAVVRCWPIHAIAVVCH